jgi:hypothetical protein
MNPCIEDNGDYLDYRPADTVVTCDKESGHCYATFYRDTGGGLEAVMGIPLTKRQFTGITGHRFPVAPEVVDELVAALQHCASVLEDRAKEFGVVSEPLRQARSVLAKLEGGQPIGTETPPLFPFRVSLHEEKGDKFILHFYCQAEDAEHAYEQAEKAHPEGEMLNATKLEGGQP